MTKSHFTVEEFRYWLGFYREHLSLKSKKARDLLAELESLDKRLGDWNGDAHERMLWDDDGHERACYRAFMATLFTWGYVQGAGARMVRPDVFKEAMKVAHERFCTNKEGTFCLMVSFDEDAGSRVAEARDATGAKLAGSPPYDGGDDVCMPGAHGCVWLRRAGQCRTETREAGWARRARQGGEQLPWSGGRTWGLLVVMRTRGWCQASAGATCAFDATG